ncbi:cobalt-precorrin-6A reductase [Actinokineospora bangkokensis]|uniref:Cobalt-precorrin-6A reductase n=1 Tax=Actinokineospora bangkokensis TaxID=1193682 RepID=A0A1Q9LPN5_9PSEU|nr:cobalt-precorrin-6A reductase [Actinokineospora bangkokensis]OLR93990.1 cobalt-precorrin-6A reductase [Actinokineospora bangkokensis]
MKVLVLGGTAEARELAAALDGAGVRVVSSLAGRVQRPRLPVGEVRVGGFGGPEKLAEHLRAEGYDAVVDATHPFAERISASAARASDLSGVPLVVLRRPGWAERAGDTWHWVDDLPAAAAALPDLGGRVFLTTGRQGLPAFAACPQWFLVRCVDPPDPPLPARHELLLDRGPYTPEGELALMRAHAIEVLVTKDSGGPLTSAKLDAARELGVPVVVVRRPEPAAGPVATGVAEVVRLLTQGDG